MVEQKTVLSGKSMSSDRGSDCASLRRVPWLHPLPGFNVRRAGSGLTTGNRQKAIGRVKYLHLLAFWSPSASFYVWVLRPRPRGACAWGPTDLEGFAEAQRARNSLVIVLARMFVHFGLGGCAGYSGQHTMSPLGEA